MHYANPQIRKSANPISLHTVLSLPATRLENCDVWVELGKVVMIIVQFAREYV